MTFAGPKGQMSDPNLVCSDILANEIIRTRQFLVTTHDVRRGVVTVDHTQVLPARVRGTGLTFCQIISEKL